MGQRNYEIERQTRLTARGLAVLFGAAALAAPGILLGATALVTMCLTALCVVVIAALTQRLIKPLTLNFLIIEPQPGTAGQTLNVAARFSHQHPAWHVVFLPNPQLGTRISSPDQQITHQFRAATRGIFPLGAMSAYRTDVLNLCRTTIRWDLPHRVLVYPHLYDLAPAGASGTGGVPAGLVPAGYTTDDVTLRAYIPGDELRRIHWPATARHGQPIVRSADIRTTQTLNVVLDNRSITSDSRAFEWVVSVATSAALSAIAAGRTVRIIHAQVARASNAPVFTNSEQLLDFATEVGALASSLPLPSARGVAAEGETVAVLQSLDDPLHAALSATSPTVTAMVFDPDPGATSRFASSTRFRIAYCGPQDSVVEVWRQLTEAHG